MIPFGDILKQTDPDKVEFYIDYYILVREMLVKRELDTCDIDQELLQLRERLDELKKELSD